VADELGRTARAIVLRGGGEWVPTLSLSHHKAALPASQEGDTALHIPTRGLKICLTASAVGQGAADAQWLPARRGGWDEELCQTTCRRAAG